MRDGLKAPPKMKGGRSAARYVLPFDAGDLFDQGIQVISTPFVRLN